MQNTETNKIIRELFHKYKTGKIIEEPARITGGLMHTMFKISTETNTYALKWLNPSIMKRNGVLDNMINSKRIANSLSKYLPVVSALNIEGRNVMQYDNMYFMLFDWIDGASIFAPEINEKHCYEIGRALGRIHKLNIKVPEVKKISNESVIYDWKLFLDHGFEQDVYWIDKYANIIDNLITWNNFSNEANDILSNFLVISHRDLDPKNVMWHQDKPYFIDWEAAGYVNPYQELLEVLNYWANDGKGELFKDKFKVLLNAYREYMSTTGVDWDCVLNSGYAGMLGWLEYSLKRALGIESTDDEEKVLGAEQVIGTIKELVRYNNQLKILKEWLSE